MLQLKSTKGIQALLPLLMHSQDSNSAYPPVPQPHRLLQAGLNACCAYADHLQVAPDCGVCEQIIDLSLQVVENSAMPYMVIFMFSYKD